jgi:deoxycytidylate deaminase
VYTGDGDDFRCAFHHGYCSSVREQNRIIGEIIDKFPELQKADPKDVQARLRKSPIGGLLEFSRAVHAEMDALLAAARKGVSTVGAKLFVTTYPCHYCARHIIAAGIDEVQYIEPYPKSLASKLHADAITSDSSELSPSAAKLQNKVNVNAGHKLKVLFRPFTGVAPRLYRRVFLKEQSLKNKHTGEMNISSPDWGGALTIKKISYVDIEAKLSDG